MSGAVKLCECEEVELDNIQTAADCIAASANPEIVEVFEHLVHAWCKEIEQVRCRGISDMERRESQ